MITMGLDISATSTGVVVYANTTFSVAAVTITPDKDLRGWERSLVHYETFAPMLGEVNPVCAFIEAYPHGAQGQRATLVEVGTLYRWALHEAGIPFTTIHPTSLKKYVADDGNATKIGMAVAVGARWDFTHTSHDVVDAYALARVGATAISYHRGESVSVKKREREVLDLIAIPAVLG
jgi:crossover junction endodeoxyribonuclease RuvC